MLPDQLLRYAPSLGALSASRASANYRTLIAKWHLMFVGNWLRLFKSPLLVSLSASAVVGKGHLYSASMVI
jgi:hypothetical protein